MILCSYESSGPRGRGFKSRHSDQLSTFKSLCLGVEFLFCETFCADLFFTDFTVSTKSVNKLRIFLKMRVGTAPGALLLAPVGDIQRRGGGGKRLEYSHAKKRLFCALWQTFAAQRVEIQPNPYRAISGYYKGRQLSFNKKQG